MTTNTAPASASIAFEKVVEVVKQSGLKILEQKAWLRINGPGETRVYVPRRPNVSRIDIAGFAAPTGTSIKLGDNSFGAVKEQLDMKGPEQTILENLKKVLKHMSSLSAPKGEAKFA
jgi:hypothetical protein